MESRGVRGSSASEDNQVYSHQSSSSSNEVVADVDTPSAASSRIPSHVFAPTSTNSVAGWSMTSNESLLSIHMGNMSFNEKSGELDPSSPLFEFPVKNLSTPTVKSTEEVGSDDEDGDGRVNDAAVKTMRQDLREKESQKKNDKEPDNLGRSMSQLSDTSCKSFAFPILTAEANKNSSTKRGTKNKKQPSSQHSTTTTTPQHTPPETPKPLRVPETPEAEKPKATQNGSPKRWFFCFSCLPFYL